MTDHPQLDVADLHHARVTAWLQANPGSTAKDLLQRLMQRGATAFIFKATEGRTVRDPLFHDLVSIAGELGVHRIGAYHVNLHGDGGLARVDAELDNFRTQIGGLPIEACMVDWETWGKEAGDTSTGGTADQTAHLLDAMANAQLGSVLLYAGLPMVPRGLNDDRFTNVPLVYPDYRSSSGADPVGAATAGNIAKAADRMVLHQWAGSSGVLGCDSNRIIDHARFDALFGTAPIIPAIDHHTNTETIMNQLPEINAGDQGDQVKRMQALLLAAGLSPGTIDGKYTTKANSPTRAALVQFQNAHGLPGDAKVTINVWEELLGV